MHLHVALLELHGPPIILNSGGFLHLNYRAIYYFDFICRRDSSSWIAYIPVLLFLFVPLDKFTYAYSNLFLDLTKSYLNKQSITLQKDYRDPGFS